MYLENLYLANFKNYSDVNVDFSKYINALVGDNGSGKTNLLDAIHFLSMTKSAFNSIDNQSILHDQIYYSIIGRFSQKNNTIVVNNSLTLGKRKKIQIDKNPIDKSADIIGMFPIVLIAPNDHALISEGGETRRKFFDSIISQFNKSYLINLMDYNHALKQRNKLLKQFSESGRIDRDLLEPYDRILISLGKDIYTVRSDFCVNYLTKIIKHYTFLTEGKETINLLYQSNFHEENIMEIYHNSLQKDVLLQRTNIGVHKDDYLFEMDGYQLKKFGSQGQQKSFLIALKLAQFDIIQEEKGFKPILLMDDIFDKLDDHRIQKLTEMIEHHEFGQVFITDARPERTNHFLEKLSIEWKVITVDNGNLAAQ
ncbi:MAG: DNA replication/repair protein RecF, partial [Cyclobacteriaceae bacterium]|nr:DNA replication/repair protein RecF [Cyclobacteriaceae bacterium]